MSLDIVGSMPSPGCDGDGSGCPRFLALSRVRACTPSRATAHLKHVATRAVYGAVHLSHARQTAHYKAS